ncbi:MAG: DNA polymerase III subunit delta [Nitriliruptoraceae bacterium]
MLVDVGDRHLTATVARMDAVVLIAGDDDLLLQRAVEARVAAACEQDPTLDVDRYDVVELDHLPELRTTSLFGGRALVVLRGVEAISGDLKNELEDYLDAPSPDAVLLLVARGTGKIPKIVKLATAAGERVDVKRPADWDDRAWDALVAGEFARASRQADPAAIAAIRSHAGTDPSAIASQVSSVCAAHSGETPVTVEDVEAVVEGHGRVSGFAVADAIADRDPQAAIVATRGALEHGDAPLAICGAVAFRMRQLLQIRGGASARDAGMSPGQHRRLQEVAARFGPGELAWCHNRVAQLDIDLKSADLAPDIVLELALIDMAIAREVGAPWNPLAARP